MKISYFKLEADTKHKNLSEKLKHSENTEKIFSKVFLQIELEATKVILLDMALDRKSLTSRAVQHNLSITENNF